MGRKKRPATQRYHDRVAGKYDGIYHDVYWAWHDRITWAHVRAHLPRDLAVRAIDLGCGTGKWGMKLLESGFHVTFVDISAAMLDQARAKVGETSFATRAEFVHADLMDLCVLPDTAFAFATAMGEPIGCAASPIKALEQIRSKMTADGTLLATFDNRLGCVDHYVESNDADGLADLLKTGRTRWLTRDRDEQFEIHTHSPEQVRKLLERTGFTLVDMIGKTVLPMRNHRHLLAEPQDARKWMALEQKLHGAEAAIGRCAHIQVATRVRPAPPTPPLGPL